MEKMEKIDTSGSGLSIAKVNKKAVFCIHNVVNLQLLKVKIEGPNNTKGEPIISVTDTNDVVVEYLPKATGEYVIHIHYNDVAIPNSPFTSKVYDINQIKVKEMPKTIQINKPATFLVEAANAGPGMLEVIVNNGQVSSSPEALGTALYAITFVPKQLIDHNIQIIFNSEPVPGSPFRLKTVGASSRFIWVQGPMTDRISVNKPIAFQVKCPANTKLTEEMFLIHSPVKERIKPEIKLIAENDHSKPDPVEDELTYDVRFTSEEVGDHIVDLKSTADGPSVQGCPFLVKVYDSKKVKLTELSDNCVLGRPVHFLIDASKAGAGNLEIIVSVNNGTSSRNVPNYVKSEGNAKFRVNFKPNEAIPHQASVKFNGENVPGSPYTINILMDNRNEINLPSIVTNLGSLRMCSLSQGIRLVLNKHAIHQALGKIAMHLPANVQPAAGFPEVLVQTPNNQRQNMELTDRGTEYEGLYQAKEVGPFQIFIYIDKYLINSSQPINCNVYDVSKVKVSGLETAILGKPFTFQVDASLAGEGTLELVVTTRRCSVKADVLMRSRGLYDVTFLPQSQTTYYVNVTFNEEGVPSNPFRVETQAAPSNGLDKMAQLSIADQADVVDRAYPSLGDQQAELLRQQAVASPVNKTSAPAVNAFDPTKIAKGEASTENTTCLVGSINIVYIELGNRLLEQLQLVAKQQPHMIEACVFSPQGNLVNSNLTYDLLSGKNSNKLKIDFTPREIGTYRIELINSFNQQSLLNHPICVECCDPSRVRLLDVRDGIVGKQQQFTIDCSKTGSGSLQLSITCKQQQVPFELFEFGPNKTQIKISSLSSNSSSAKINSKSGRFLVKYRPEIDLPHYIDVFYNGHQVAGCPQLISISDASELLTIMRDSISKSIQLNVDAEMLIEETGSTQGLIEIGEFNCKVFDAENQPVKNYLHELSDLNGSNKKQYKLQFRPIKIGTHRIEVFYLNKHLTGSPFLTECFDINKVKLQPIQNTNFVVNENIFLSLDRKDAGYAELDVVVTSPLGRHLPIELTANDQKEQICFKPTVQGKYKIAINYGQLTVPGTPITFVANSAPNDQPNGLAKSRDTNGESMQIKPQQQQKALTNGHQTNHVNNAAINQQIKKEPQQANAAQPIILFKQMSGSINERFMFTIDSNGYKGLPLINIDGPEQEEDLLVEEKNRIFYVSFVPVQVGAYEIKISWSGKRIATHKVNIVNLNAIRPKQGWSSLLSNQDTQSIALSLNQLFKVTFLTGDAGIGSLVGEVILPNGKMQANIVEHSASNKYKLNFTPKLNGKYLIRLFYSNLLLPQCPLVAITSPQFLLGHNANATLDNKINTQILNGLQKDGQLSQAPRKLSMQHESNEVCVSLKGQGLAGARVGQIGQFIIDGTASGPGSPQCTLKLSESDFKYDKSEEDRPVLNVTEIQNKIFRVSYKVKLPGVYILNILWGSKQVSGCPLKLHVTPSCDASLVEAAGAGLKECVVNKPCAIKIDTSKAGPSQLAAHCAGPKKAVMCSLVDELNGIYQLNFTPVETGKHTLTIKYGGENIPNSPFTVKVHSQANGSEPDASKVRVYGPGIEHGVLPLFQSRFICETKGAGAGQLTVRIRGPKGAFRVEMARDNTKERSILCKYDPTEPGAYRIEIKWSGEHVPNSPFDVFIFDTQLELNRFLQNGSLGERSLPLSLSALGNLPITATGTLPHPHHQTILAPQPISFHKTLPSALAPHPHLIHPITIGPHYSLPAPPFAGPLNPAFIPINGNEPFFNPYAIPWRGS